MGSNKKFEVFFNYVIPTVSCVLGFIVIAQIKTGNRFCALIISGVAYVCYPFVGWYQNRGNKVLEESTNTLSGGLGQFND